MIHDINQTLAELHADIERVRDQAKALDQKIEEYGLMTARFLEKCTKYGIDLVSIGRKTERVSNTLSWPFNVNGSVFTNEVDDENGSPAIWAVVKEMGVGGGCGNSNQYQLDSSAMLISGVYELKDGKWHRSED